jgi:hypothetical protein
MLCTLERWSPIQSCLKEEEQDMQIIVFTPLSKQYIHVFSSCKNPA